ncbi:MAG: glycoside hydrolase family 3 C-terminal domain-containing protein, partial [Ruminococcus flavefaciens]|nr:glycoside hydrolase family 3 C-terminal domain-containing protein [Ruminococcus flavefaciens]
MKSGKPDEKLLDHELLDVIRSATKAVKPLAGKPFDVEKHHAMAAKASGQSIVLLKNEGGILPLKKGTKVAVIG